MLTSNTWDHTCSFSDKRHRARTARCAARPLHTHKCQHNTRREFNHAVVVRKGHTADTRAARTGPHGDD